MKVAIIQRSPILLDLPRTIDKAVSLIGNAAANGAGLVVFPEAFFPGYPAWIWRLRPGGDWGLTDQLHKRLLENAVDLAKDDLGPIRKAAREHQVTVVSGLHERDGSLSRSTLYNTVIIIGPDGELLNRHRKLMPTNPERMVWGFGDASGLRVIDTPGGRIGSLLCWESYMPLARFALYAQGIEVYIAPTYDSGDGWVGTMQHIAREGCCWVISAGVATRNHDIPGDFPERERLYPNGEEWINPGDSVVVAPGGEIVAGPFHEIQDNFYAEIDIDKVAISRRSLDVAGHYSRPDIFTLHINNQPQSPIDYD
jgi:nitrilase